MKEQGDRYHWNSSASWKDRLDKAMGNTDKITICNMGDSSRRFSWTNQLDMATMTPSKSGWMICCVWMLLKMCRACHKDIHIHISATFISLIEILCSAIMLAQRSSWTRSWIYLYPAITKTHLTIYSFCQMLQLIRYLYYLVPLARVQLMVFQTFCVQFRSAMKVKLTNRLLLSTSKED